MVNCIYSSWHFSLGRLATAKGDHLCYPEHRIFIKWRCHIGYMCLLLFFSVYQRYLLTGSNYKFCFSLRQHDRSTAFHLRKIERFTKNKVACTGQVEKGDILVNMLLNRQPLRTGQGIEQTTTLLHLICTLQKSKSVKHE